MVFIVCYIAENENEPYFHASLKSSLSQADHVLVILSPSKDGTEKYLAEMQQVHKNLHVRLSQYRHELKGANGMQRNQYLEVVKREWPDAWVLVLDCDEIASDDFFLAAVEETSVTVWDVPMVHYIHHLGLKDSTFEEHWCPRRFFKISEDLHYPEVEHPVLLGSFKEVGKLDKRRLLHHFGYAKNIWALSEKYKNHLKKSNMHTPEYLRRWIKNHATGLYPATPTTEEEMAWLPWTCKEAFGL